MKDIPGFEGLYAITEDGRVWSYPRSLKTRKPGRSREWRGRFLKAHPSTQGYLLVTLSRTRHHTVYIHKLVARAFIPNPENLPQVNHKNGNKKDNRIDNLEWATCQENIIHAYRNGLKPVGVAHWKAKLNPTKVRQIREQAGQGVAKSVIARRFGIARTTVVHIARRESWGHVD